MGLLSLCVRLVRYAVLSAGGLAGVGFTLIVVLQARHVLLHALCAPGPEWLTAPARSAS